MPDKKEQEDLVGNHSTGSGGLSISSTLALIFVTLKLTNLINWHWGWVLSPLWISFFVQLFLLALYTTAVAIEEHKNKKTK